MKKIYIAALVVLTTAALNSCVQEKSFKDVKIGENDIVFSMQGSATTRSAEVTPVQRGVKLELEATGSGDRFYLSETIEDLNYVSAATRGTPVYTENVGKMHENLGVYIKNGNNVVLNTTTGFYAMDEEMVGGGWRYQGEFDGWPDSDQTPLDFYLWLPADTSGLGFKNFTPGKTNNNLSFSFSYTSPTTAADQQDIIFAARPISKSDADANRVNGVPVLFNHALTAVKFAIENYDTENQITIKSVSFSGLVGSATCTVTPAVENNYRDKTTEEYSSANHNVVNWVIPEDADRSTTYSSGTYADTVYYAPNGSFGNKGKYPSSFSAAGNKHNLNDANATQTFWFIPQQMTDDVKLTIVYTFGNAEEVTGVLDFGKSVNKYSANKPVVWEAGQIRTYTIRVDDVNVMIKDTVNIVAKHTEQVLDPTGHPFDAVSYSGSTKSNVTITNTGNTDAYIRAAIIGQWLDSDGNPVFGFTDYTTGEVALVASWYEDQFKNNTFKQGKFTGLPGYNGTSTTNHNWTLGSDGFYYYENIVKEGETIPAADSLFTKYTVGAPPAVKVAGGVKDVYFVMEIATQAVSAKKPDGTDYTRTEAWERCFSNE